VGRRGRDWRREEHWKGEGRVKGGGYGEVRRGVEMGGGGGSKGE